MNDNATATIAASQSLTVSGAVTGAAGKSLTVSNSGTGTLVVATTGSIGVPLVANGNVSFTAQTSGSAKLVQTVPSLSIGATGYVALADATGGTPANSNRTVLVTGSTASSSSTFSVAAGGTLDLGSNDAIVHGDSSGQFATLLGLVGQNGATSGIISSWVNADTTGREAIAAVQLTSTDVGGSGFLSTGLFDGQSVVAGDVLLKTTYYGDTNLDGKVDGTDYSRIDAGFLASATGWQNGGFVPGVVNGTDYALIDASYGANLTALPASLVASPASEVAAPASSSAVPEPTSLGLLAMGASALLSRRIRRRK